MNHYSHNQQAAQVKKHELDLKIKIRPIRNQEKRNEGSSSWFGCCGSSLIGKDKGNMNTLAPQLLAHKYHFEYAMEDSLQAARLREKSNSLA
jgi:hypothetical protein